MIFNKKPQNITSMSGPGAGGPYLRSAKKLRNTLFWRKVFRFGMLIMGGGFLIVMLITIQIAYNLPDVESINTYVPNETTKIFSADGIVLAELHREENRMIIPLKKMSDFIKAAVLASEDDDFYKHYGISPKGILRAFAANLKAGGAAQGGSTITQQLARNVFLYKRKKVVRKIAEILLALQIERRYTKDEILELYLNQIYWGHNSYGIESASQMYFGKHAVALTIPEAAMLAGILRAPEYYSPYRNPNGSRLRKDIVLNRMAELGYITGQEYFEAKEVPLVLAGRKKLKYKAPYFTSYVVKQLEEMYGEDVVYNDGLRVYTTLEWDMQKRGEDVVEKYIQEGMKPHWTSKGEVPSLNYTQAALMSMDPRTGYIKSWVGGHDFLKNEFDHIYQAKRQPGSAFKPFTYLTALNMGFSPGTVLEDSPVTFNTIEGPYAPQNYTKRFLGGLSLRKALERSVNVVAVKINDLVDPSNVIVTCRKLGIKSYLPPVLSLTLGSAEVSMLEMAKAYGVIANSGVRIDPVSITKIEDRNGNELYKHTIQQSRVFDANITNTLIDMMKGVVLHGTGRGALINRPMAGKTGTTTDYRDAWFFGFTPQILTVTWVGNNNNSPMNEVTGGLIPARMWHDYMVFAAKKVPVAYFPRPYGLVLQRICLDSGALATPICPGDRVVEDLIWKNNQMDRSCHIHNVFAFVGGGQQTSIAGDDKKKSWFGTSRPDWEQTFFPDTGKVVNIAAKEKEEEEEEEEEEEQPKKKKWSDKIFKNSSQGL
ncbi:transglycosylase domain-containing protein [Candidatus Margulisiibacteriota bacterium]